MENNRNIQKTSELRDYYILFFQNKFIILAIFLTCFITALIYSSTAQDIYTAEGLVRVSIPKSDILTGPLLPQFQEFGTDRYIANEIEVLKSLTLREIAAKSIIDTFDQKLKSKGSFGNNKPSTKEIEGSDFYIVYKNVDKKSLGAKSRDAIARQLKGLVDIDQKRGMDLITLKCDSPSPYEAFLIINTYIDAYIKFNLDASRNQLTLARDFLENQRENKLTQLNISEDAIRKFKEGGNIIVLDEQARILVEQLSQFEAQMNASDIEAKSKEQALLDFKRKLEIQDQSLAKYIQNISAEPYIKVLQEAIAKAVVQKDLIIYGSNRSNPDSDPEVAKYINSINELQEKLDRQLGILEANLSAYTPEELRGLSIETLKLDLEVKSAKTRAAELRKIVKDYEYKFGKLPKQTIELAKLERDQKSSEKLFLLIEEKYQEALIAEQSKPGNVQIIDKARIPLRPSKPNRNLIVMLGVVLGGGLAFGFIFLKKYLDVTIRTPEDIQNRGKSVLGWIPNISDFVDDFGDEHEVIVESSQDSIPTEAFLSIKMRLQYSRLTDEPIKTILITSPAPKDGKTFICANLGSTFALTNNKVLIIDFDLRRPRLHNILKENKQPGISDYLFGKASLEEIIRDSFIKDLKFIPAGTIIPNPAEIISSEQVVKFLENLKPHFDFVLLDSPPIVAVADGGVLSRLCDATVLVTSTNQTRLDLMDRAVEILDSVQGHFVGILLNNFSTRNGYGSYYKYYHYYSTGEKKWYEKILSKHKS